jgi:hypothetical protein
MRFPEVDYSIHPAYSPYQNKLQYDDAFVLRRIQEVDALHAEFCSLTSPVEKDAASALAQIKNCMEQILSHAREKNISILAEEWLDTSVKWTVADLSHEFARRIFSSREYRGKILSAERSKQLSLMQEQGLYITDLPPDIYADIRRLALEYRSALRERATSDRFNRAVTNVSFNSPLWKSIKRAVKEAGILDVLSEFKQNRMTLLGAGLEYSCPEQDWYQSLYADVGLFDSPMQYLHVDEGDCLPKSMIYVTPVSDENGATRAIPGSNRWEKSECQFRMHKALDRVVGNRYAKFVRKAHYRPLARHAELRRIFMELPKPFQGSSHFGDDVLVGTKLADTLAKQEIPYLSQGGQALVFDGPHLLHRGSLVKSGERMALQVIYRNQNEESIKSYLTNETLLKDQVALARKYVRKFVMGYV